LIESFRTVGRGIASRSDTCAHVTRHTRRGGCGRPNHHHKHDLHPHLPYEGPRQRPIVLDIRAPRYNELDRQGSRPVKTTETPRVRPSYRSDRTPTAESLPFAGMRSRVRRDGGRRMPHLSSIRPGPRSRFALSAHRDTSRASSDLLDRPRAGWSRAAA
jgi:hypothetical protein